MESEGMHHEASSKENVDFVKLLKAADEELYPGCKTFSSLSFFLHLYHLKCLHRWTEKSFTMLLELLLDAFPGGMSLSKSFYQAKKIIQALGLDYKKIHACPNHCMLYWGETENQELCRICGSSRWAVSRGSNQNDSTNVPQSSSLATKKKPAEVLRYFPLIPRLKRLYASTKTSKNMLWHEEGRKKDGKLRHPADGAAWKAIDDRYSDFSSDPRNVRLALASDGFNPFRTMSTSYSTWPVVLVNYNMSPWICMKQSSFILSMIIPGEKGPGNDIDTYLQPLIQELHELWEGVDTYDAFTQQMFQMRAILMWTINDFPAYAYLSGWSTKGEFACPCCAEFTHSRWLYNGGKHCYMGHRRWLPEDHSYRRQKENFDGVEEVGIAPTRLDSCNVLKQLDDIQFSSRTPFKRKQSKKKRKVGDQVEELNEEGNIEVRQAANAMNWWKKKSIFFMLPYWQYNLLRHNLDVMHIEKMFVIIFLAHYWLLNISLRII
ncbi:uncharacterized protein LOC126674798 [Mercurialis annua]|uniref:uncharacterized protein LOC126674798 n=1 Tax=Mercurialis annua TaxID=3986 RepID=UPI00215E5E37|nr:uncharacterized protein LOC126674798 [Mercurialis annua]XP_050225270.1 uncharacterized protein LOC126674798 [Mercurialis annua]XP_050225271.1 uncharacterized protein LOC126674798 [Mercurialis annua]XP_050225272.1 uncharacterized protein LOC126674798 [Mercurialis annua]